MKNFLQYKLTLFCIFMQVISMPAIADNLKAENLLKVGTTQTSILYVKAKTQPARAVIVYHHGLIVEQIGYQAAKEQGYDVNDFLNAFAQHGYDAIAPIRPFSLDQAWTKDLQSYYQAEYPAGPPIFVVGFSRGAESAIKFVASEKLNWGGLILLSPVVDRGMYPTVPLDLDTLITIGSLESAKLKAQIKEQLAKNFVNFPIIKNNYPATHQSFWTVMPAHFKDLINFIEGRLVDFKS